jgi:hypothetical protein
MRLIDATAELRRALEQAGLSVTRLDPWEAWKVFKAFCHREVEEVYDCPCIQFALGDYDPEHPDRVHVLFVRQFSTWEVASSGEWEDASLGKVVIDLAFSDRALVHHEEFELWSMDFRSLEEFSSVVEGNPVFQAATGHEPVATDVYFEPDFD